MEDKMLASYVCPSCKAKDERLVKYAEADKQECVCGCLTERQISMPHIKFGASFCQNYSEEPDHSGKPYKGFYYDEEYVAKQDEQGVSLV
jgi:hypothetical protein